MRAHTLTLVALLAATSVGWWACSGSTASRRSAARAAAAEGPVLLVGGSTYHLEADPEGRVFMVRPDDAGAATRREVKTYEEFRTLYGAGDPVTLPERLPTEGLLIHGWHGLDCVRAGTVCGARPAEPVPPEANLLRVLLTFGR